MFLQPHGKRKKGLSGARNVFDIDHLFDEFFQDSFMPTWLSGHSQIKVDIRETDKEYLIEAELPGVKKEQLQVELDQNRLTISVTHDEQAQLEHGSYIQRERKSGSYSRSFYVENVNDERVTAKFENGVLYMNLPKRKNGVRGKKRIAIQ